MIISFRNQGTRDVFDGRDTKAARRACPLTLWKVAGRKLDQLDVARSIQDLAAPPGNRLEELKGDRDGEYSIRINDQYRICFRWSERGPKDVEIVDYH